MCKYTTSLLTRKPARQDATKPSYCSPGDIPQTKEISAQWIRSAILALSHLYLSFLWGSKWGDHLIGQIAKVRRLRLKSEAKGAGRTVAMFGHDNICDPPPLGVRIIDLIPVDEHHDICVVFDAPALAKI